MAVAGSTSSRGWSKFYSNGSSNPPIRIFQWNILADVLAVSRNSASGQKETSFIKTPIECLEWDHRLPLILKEISACKPSIACLQEVDRFKDIDVPGYDGMFLPKPDSPCTRYFPNNGPDGCAMLYDTSKLTLVNRRDIVLRNKSDQPTNQVAILAKFTVESGGKRICVGVTHLKAKGGFESLREAQGMSLLTAMKDFSNGDPFVICGDFNGVPSEPVCSSYRSSKGPAIKSAYAEYSPTGQDPLFTTMKYREAGLSKYTGDYIWYDSDHLRVSELYDLLTESAIGETTGLPSKTYPSDHMSLCADFIFKT